MSTNLAYQEEFREELIGGEIVAHFKCSLYDDFDIALDDIFSGLLS